MLKKLFGIVLTLLCKPVAYILRNDLVRQEIWKNTNFRPEGHLCHWCCTPNNLEEAVYNLATRQSAEYVLANMSSISGTADRYFMLKYCVQRAMPDGLVLEFGVYNGDSVNLIADNVDTTVHGFDSFEGLPEDWESCQAGQFTRDGKLPEVRQNVQLHAGWFDETLPEFVSVHREQVAFLHVDSDLYSSACTIFSQLKDQIRKGTVIVFDEYFNYPNWQEHEFKAFQEFVQEYDIKYEYIAYCSRGYSVGVLIL